MLICVCLSVEGLVLSDNHDVIHRWSTASSAPPFPHTEGKGQGPDPPVCSLAGQGVGVWTWTFCLSWRCRSWSRMSPPALHQLVCVSLWQLQETPCPMWTHQYTITQKETTWQINIELWHKYMWKTSLSDYYWHMFGCWNALIPGSTCTEVKLSCFSLR